jgi:hypothetical protein
MPTRRDPSRRVTPELMAFYRRRAHQLRAEAYRNLWRTLWEWLRKIVQRPGRPSN